LQTQKTLLDCSGSVPQYLFDVAKIKNLFHTTTVCSEFLISFNKSGRPLGHLERRKLSKENLHDRPPTL
jgi:hypothetical protein